MVDYFFYMFWFLSIYNIKLKGLDSFFYDYMKIENTNSIKGIFVWLIIFCHKNSYGIYHKYIFPIFVKNLGQKVVSMFLFYSGFGINESIRKKGVIYIKSLPIKAIILFIKSQIIILLYLITNIFIFRLKITLKQYILSFCFKSSLGNSNWFAFTIIILYLYSYLSFRLFIGNIFFGVIILNILCFLHIILIFKYFYPYKIYAVDNILCFITGFIYSLQQKYIDKIMMNNDISYFGMFSMIILIYHNTFCKANLIIISINNALFSILVVFFSMKVKFNNDFLKFLNSHSYSIYFLQKLVMRIVYSKNIFKKSNFIQISFEFTSIFFISSLFDKYTQFIDKLFKNFNIKIGINKYIIINNRNINNIDKK